MEIVSEIVHVDLEVGLAIAVGVAFDKYVAAGLLHEMQLALPGDGMCAHR